jgi:hypothetical protein
MAVAGTAEGDIIITRGVDVVTTHSDFCAGKSVNALWSVGKEAVIAGLKDGTIMVTPNIAHYCYRVHPDWYSCIVC